jgi:cytochrome b561
MTLKPEADRYHLGSIVLHWAMLLLSAAGKPTPFFGLELPALLGADKDLSHQRKDVHEFGGSLFHHYIQRDNTLQRMLPR